LGREAYSNYGPTADTGGLMQNHAPTIYAYPNLQALLEGEAAGGRKTKLPGPGGKPVTERPDRGEERQRAAGAGGKTAELRTRGIRSNATYFSIYCGPLDVVDDEHVDGSAARLRFQAERLAQRRGQRR